MIDNNYPGKAFYKVGKTLLNSSRTLMKCVYHVLLETFLPD